MAKPGKNLVRFFGLNIQGDFGPWTMYTSKRGEVVIFDRAPPLSPASSQQTRWRNVWRNAAATWKSLMQSQRDDWEEASIKARLRITGYNLFIFYMTTERLSYIRTIEQQTGITLVTA